VYNSIVLCTFLHILGTVYTRLNYTSLLESLPNDYDKVYLNCFSWILIFQDLRRRRTESSIELRKQKKEDQVLKRRNISVADEAAEDAAAAAAPNDQSGAQQPNAANAAQPNAGHMSLQEIIELINTTKSPEQLFPAVQSVRKMLSRERNPPIDDVIRAQLVHELVGYLSCAESPMLQFEAAWALTNIASGTSSQTRHVVESGAVAPFVRLLSSPNSNVCEQAVWALGNIAGDGAELRDLVIRCGVVEPLLALVQPDTPSTFLRNITWTLSNLCRNKNPAPSMHVLHQLLPALSGLLFSSDKEVLTDTCWALSYITDGPNEKIDAVIKTGAVARLVELLQLHHKTEASRLVEIFCEITT
jgi:importin subunit alpha-2